MQNIYDFVKSEENTYQSTPIPIEDGWEWLMPDHLRKSLFYKYGRFVTGNSDDKPFKNIVLPILRLRYRTEGIDVKDINLYIDDKDYYWKSFLVKKYHDKYAREEHLDTLLDNASETDIDYGGVLLKKVGDDIEVVPWQRVAFCDQTDVLSGVIAEKHNYAPDQLLEMGEYGWGDEKNGATITLEELITLSESNKSINDQTGRKAKTPGRYIEVYEIHGMLPSWYLSNDEEDKKYTRQMHILAFYKDEKDNKQGVTLFKGKEKESPYKFRADMIFGRALGYGGVEELFEPQVWTNYSMIRMKQMLDAASKIIFQSSDASFKTRNNLNNVDNLEVLTVEDGKNVSQIDTYPRNMQLFDKAVQEWEIHAREVGASTESLAGVQPSSGTPFKLQELLVNQSLGLHEYRQGKFATFVEELYRDWILPKIIREITKGVEFISELSLDEMKYIVDGIVKNKSKKYFTEKVLNGETIQEGEIQAYEQKVRDEFMRSGNKKFIKILKDEMKNLPIDIEINIAGKQKNLANMTDKIVNIIRQVIATPQLLQNPGMVDLFNQIIEYSGLNPVDFAGIEQVQTLQTPRAIQAPSGGTTEPLQDFSQSNQKESLNIQQ